VLIPSGLGPACRDDGRADACACLAAAQKTHSSGLIVTRRWRFRWSQRSAATELLLNI
jgi:hypothetical protein